MSNKREPISEPAKQKKKKIIKEGFNLICEKGYHNVNCIDIAKKAEVSTGIIYQYFDNKKDIFINGMNYYIEENIDPIINTIEEKLSVTKNIKDIVEQVLDLYIDIHKIEKKAHSEVMAMTWLDEDIGNIFLKIEINLTNKINNIFKENNINIENGQEKIHILFNIIDNYCHDLVYHNHDTLNYNIMKENIIKISLNLLS